MGAVAAATGAIDASVCAQAQATIIAWEIP